jgi:choline-sulfatase
VLAGKQHFVGPDRLHGFRAQLAHDLHASRPHGQADWSAGIRPAARPWPGVAQAGPGHTEEIDADDAVEAAALAYLRDPVRRERPWALHAGFIAPHFPLVAPPRFFDLYPPPAVDLPALPPGHVAGLHPVFARMRTAFGMVDYPEEQTRRARAAYYGLITYLDEKVGRLLEALEQTGQRDDTLVVYTSDHGEMAGEHGMWRKSNFYEHSVRVPLIVSWPRRLPAGRRVPQVVSLIDLVATLVDAAGGAGSAPEPPGAPASDLLSLDGRSLLPLARGVAGAAAWDDEAFSEYLAHGVVRPVAMLRRGRYKLIYSLDDPPLLFDLDEDPGELHDLGTDPAHAAVREELRARLLARWDPVLLERRLRRSQQERLLIDLALHGEMRRA